MVVMVSSDDESNYGDNEDNYGDDEGIYMVAVIIVVMRVIMVIILLVCGQDDGEDTLYFFPGSDAYKKFLLVSWFKIDTGLSIYNINIVGTAYIFYNVYS